MTTKLSLFFILFLAACGPKEVKFPDGREAISPYQVTNAERVNTDQEGIFTKAPTLNGSSIVTGGQSYPFSEYSSYQALNYYAAKPMGSSASVRFRGEIVKNKLVVELIEDK
jgi:hypothetical protein